MYQDKATNFRNIFEENKLKALNNVLCVAESVRMQSSIFYRKKESYSRFKFHEL